MKFTMVVPLYNSATSNLYTMHLLTWTELIFARSVNHLHQRLECYFWCSYLKRLMSSFASKAEKCLILTVKRHSISLRNLTTLERRPFYLLPQQWRQFQSELFLFMAPLTSWKRQRTLRSDINMFILCASLQWIHVWLIHQH